MITGEQVKAARKLLGWAQMTLGLEAGTHQQTVLKFERGEGRAEGRTISAFQRALESGGVEFTNGGEPGVRLKNAAAKPAASDEAAMGDIPESRGDPYVGSAKQWAVRITPAESKAARKLLGWSQEKLATELLINENSVSSFERRQRLPRQLDLVKLRRVFESAGVEFTAGEPGVRRSRAQVPVNV
jgi:transcriptional regulator with XRE-family HTH domain